MHVRPAVVAALVLASALPGLVRPALADRADAHVHLGGTATAAVEMAGDAATVTFLASSGTGRKIAITVKAVKGSSLAPDVRLVGPDGSAFDIGGAGGTIKTTATSWTAKFDSIPTSGLWRVEVRGADGTSGGFTCTVKGKDAKSLVGSGVLPSATVLEVPFDVGANQAVTISVKRASGSRAVPRLQIADRYGNGLEDGDFLGSTNTRSGSASLKAYRLPVSGSYKLRIVPDAGNGGSVSYSIKTAAAKVKGAVPVANPGERGEAEASSRYSLNGAGSTGSGTLEYLWAQVAGPAVTLSDPRSAAPTFTAPAAGGALGFELSVRSGGVLSLAVPVTVESGKRPLADAGRTLSVGTGELVTLDGSKSSSRSTKPFLHRWRQISGPTVTLSDPFAAQPTFTAPGAAGVLVFGLTADDRSLRSAEDRAVVVVGDPARPAADAGRTQFVRRMSTVHLAGVASRTASGVLDGGLQWTQVSGAPVVLTADDSGWAAFTAPKQDGDLVFELVAGGDAATADRVTVHVRTAETGTTPVTRAGSTVTAVSGNVTINAGSSVDTENDPLTFLWGQFGGPALAPSNVVIAQPVLSLPAGNETRTYVVLANDGSQYGPPDTTAVRNTGYSGLPSASAGQDRAVAAGALVTLDGTGSSRTQGSGILTFRWRQISANDWFDVDAQDPGFNPAAPQPTFRVPSDLSSLSSRRTITFELVVNDGTADSLPDFVTVVATGLPLNGLPQLTAQASTTTPIAGATVNLTAQVTDRDGDPVTLQWLQTSGTSVTLNGATTAAASFTAPSSGTYSFTCTADDGFDDVTSAPIVIVVDAPPTAVATATPPNGPAGTNVTISGTSSSDPAGQPLTFSWTRTAGSSGPASSTDPSFSFIASAGQTTFRLVVSDGRQSSQPVSVSFSTANPIFVAPSVTTTSGNPLSTAPYGSNLRVNANATGGGGGPITYTWRQIDQGGDPTVSLSATNVANPTFTAPSPGSSAFGATLPGATFGVVATDGLSTSTEATVRVTFFASFNNSAGVSGADSVWGVISTKGGCTGGSCHSPSSTSCGSAGAGMNLATASNFYNQTVNVNSCSSSKKRVLANDPSNSYFLDRLKGIGGSQMGSLTNAEKNLISDWISQGAQNN
ncbi:MAG: hypothetical protein HMLKMBBP_02621 [Planctomycetes bacterium]|nr:hypothetical protein [Planctomycetota bacterium]